MAEQAPRVNNPCESRTGRARRQWVKLSEISVQLETEGRSSSAPLDGRRKAREREKRVDNFGSRATKHRGRPFA